MPPEDATGVEIDVLGPLRVRTTRGPVEIAGTKERTVLARLVAGGGRTVSVDELADLLWGSSPPRSAAKSVQNSHARPLGEHAEQSVGAEAEAQPRLSSARDQVILHQPQVRAGSRGRRRPAGRADRE